MYDSYPDLFSQVYQLLALLSHSLCVPALQSESCDLAVSLHFASPKPCSVGLHHLVYGKGSPVSDDWVVSLA